MNSEVEAVVQQIGQFEAMLNRDLAQDPTSESLKHDKTYLQGRLLGLQKQKNILRRRQGCPAGDVSEASPAIQQFWRQLTKAEMQGDFLRLAEGTHFFGDETWATCLWCATAMSTYVTSSSTGSKRGAVL
eukprot:jgi/Chrzof1/2234/Cz11g07200.t1